MSVTPIDVAGVAMPAEGTSLWKSARRRLLRNRAAMGGLIVLVIIGALAILAPYISAHAMDDISWEDIGTPPDWAGGYYFGTDSNGRDLFARTLYGARVSLMVGILASIVSLVIGVTYGAVAGYLGGAVDNVMMRIVDILYSLP